MVIGVCRLVGVAYYCESEKQVGIPLAHIWKVVAGEVHQIDSRKELDISD